jgi:hypothetical protein
MGAYGSNQPPRRQPSCNCGTAGSDARYLIVLTPRLKALIAALQADRDPAHQHEIYRRFDSAVLE